MEGGKILRLAGIWLVAGIVVSGANPPSAAAGTIGSNLAAGMNDSVCSFQSLEPETRTCTIGQIDLNPSHSATDGVVAPFDGVIVRWSVITGAPLPGTGAVKLALRSMPPGYLERGPEVELPMGPPGTRYTFPERMRVLAGQHVGLWVSVANRSTQEAGVPIAFRQDGVGTVNLWAGEQFESIWEGHQDGVELLMQAEIEPDGDHDGYGDLTQDCSPNELGSDQRCDLFAPAIKHRSAARQAFLKNGRILVHASVSDAGVVSATGRLMVMGSGRRWASRLRGAEWRLVEAGGWTTLRLRVQRRALKAVRVAAHEGNRVIGKVVVAVVDTKGNERRELVEVNSR